jgi:hypothetical protein
MNEHYWVFHIILHKPLFKLHILFKTISVKFRFLKIGVLLYKIVFPDFDKTAEARLQIFTISCPRISISHNTVYTLLSWTARKKVLRHQLYGYGTPRTTASRIQICMREAANLL